MKTVLRWYDYFTINIYWFGLTTLSQTNALVYPLLVQQFVGEETKGTFFGTLRLWGLMVALLVQALMGLLSDRSMHRWGRRRPFVLVGTLANIACIVAVGFSAGLTGMTGFWILFAIAILQQAASNIAHGAEQGLIPDLVPENQRGRFSGVKAVMELLPVVVVGMVVAPLLAEGSLWGTLGIAIGVLALVMTLTMFVKEKPQLERPPALDWTPFLRLLLMTGLFTVIILGLREGIQFVGQLAVALDSVIALSVVMGLAGLAAMVIAVGLGVWASVRVSIGQAARHNTAFTWWVITRLAFLVGTTNLSGFVVYFVQDRLGFTKEEAAEPAGQLMMLIGLLILISALLSGWLADKFGHKRLVAFSGLLATLGTIILVLTTDLTLIRIGGCMVGVATGLFFTASWALGTQLVPQKEAGRYLGISNLAGAGAGAVGAYIGGPIADLLTANVVSDIPGLGYVVLFTIYAGLFLFSVVALTGVRKPSKA